MGSQCLFNEPWIGECGKPSIGVKPDDAWGDYVGCTCESHAKEKCVVCGRQAFTRCMASIGVMCGRPLCELCGKGEMCDQHSSDGPVQLIASLRTRLTEAEALLRDIKERGGAMLTLIVNHTSCCDKGIPSNTSFETFQLWRLHCDKVNAFLSAPSPSPRREM